MIRRSQINGTSSSDSANIAAIKTAVQNLNDWQGFVNYSEVSEATAALTGLKAVTTKTLVVASPRYFVGINVYNPNATTVFLKFYDAASIGAVTEGTTAVNYMIPIPGLSSVILEGTNAPKKTFAAGIVVAAVTAYADTESTTPATGLYISNINLTTG